MAIKVYMKKKNELEYMSMIETLSDVNNTFLSRREITCTFKGLGGKLQETRGSRHDFKTVQA
ncbi:hypothetical protein [Candidatus Nitrosotenuis chungbukensis]|uniref:hypothetical protein n=1 Tax=Candidatus Nitrosotenuis chungbukensis TaxID=1353246 RepID=UPI003B96962B